MLDINGNEEIRDVSSRGIPGLLGAPEGSIIGGPGSRAVRVTRERFPELDKTYVAERDKLTELRQRAEAARQARKEGKE